MRRDSPLLGRAAGIVLTFIKMGFMTFGGGYAMIPLIEEEVVGKKAWMDKERMLEIFAVAQSLPGSLSINTSILIGYEIGRIPGALAAVTGAALPPFLTLTVFAAFFGHYHDNPIVDAAFTGVKCAVVALIWHAGMGTAKSSIKDKTSIVMLIVTVLLMLFTPVNPAILILLAALLGIGSMFVNTWKERKRKDRSGTHAV